MSVRDVAVGEDVELAKARQALRILTIVGERVVGRFEVAKLEEGWWCVWPEDGGSYEGDSFTDALAQYAQTLAMEAGL